MKYSILHSGYVSHVETVEADSPEGAIAASEEGGYVSLCNQCAREWDPGDSEIYSIEDEGGEIVWEQTVARPMPTREQIAEAHHEPFCQSSGECSGPQPNDYVAAAAVLALLKGE